MGRLYSNGYELQNILDEQTSTSGNTNNSINTSIVHGGLASAKVTSADTSGGQFLNKFLASVTTGNVFFKMAYYISTLPSSITPLTGGNSDVTIAAMADNAGSSWAELTIDASGVVRIYQDGSTRSVVGTSSALSTGTWHTLEVGYGSANSYVEARVDGVSIGSTSSAAGLVGVNQIAWGLAIFAPTEKANAVMYYDDIAVNDTTGSFQNSWPGSTSMVYLQPSGAGDNTHWTPLSGSNFANVNDVPPNEATSTVRAAVSGNIDDYAIDTPSGSLVGATVNVVQVGTRYAGNSATQANNPTFKVRFKAASAGTVSEGTAINPSATAYKTNANADPKSYPLTLYQNPDASTITSTTLGSSQIGLNCTVTGSGTDVVRVTNVWALVDFTPSGGSDDSVTTSDSSAVTDVLEGYSDTIATREQVTVVIAASTDLNITVSDASTITENVPAPALSYRPNVSDTTAVTENVSLSITPSINVNDSSAVTENVQRLADENPKVTDSTAVTENTALLIPFLLVSTSDTTSITESVTASIPGITPDQINVNDSSAVTENVPTPKLSYQVNVNDTSAITENLTLNDIEIEVISDASTITENVAVKVDESINVNDTSGITENVVVLRVNLIVNVSDASTVSDSIQRNVQENISVSDSTTITENVSLVVSTPNISVSDASTITENVSVNLPGGSSTIKVSDSTSLTDRVGIAIIGGFWWQRKPKPFYTPDDEFPDWETAKNTRYNSSNQPGWYDRSNTNWEDQS